jgi:transposase
MSVSESTLYVAFELSRETWVLAFTIGLAIPPWVRGMAAGDWPRVVELLREARRRWGLPETVPVVSCYEAGREGFWVHRALTARGMTNHVVDSSSIEVNRRARRLKTDRIDAVKLVRLLVRWSAGDTTAWRAVRVPSAADEAARLVSRTRTMAVQERTRVMNQLRSLLTTFGTTLPSRLPAGWWTTVSDWTGAPLPAAAQLRAAQLTARLVVVESHVAAIEAEHVQRFAALPADSAARRLLTLRGVAETSVAVLLEEGLVWRAFRNRREVAGFLGFVPTPYTSGARERTLGVAGGPWRLQTVAIQLAWGWVRWQKASPLTRWYHARFGTGKRARRIGIIALARKLLIALWRFATTGVAPADAILKSA